jgi:hypothetical protein
MNGRVQMMLTNEPNQRNEIRKAPAERRSPEKLKRVLSKVGDALAEAADSTVGGGVHRPCVAST